MSKQNVQETNQYEIVIIECCQNCQSHQTLTRHSEWKYFEQFNELKKKIQKYVPNAIVIKNPVPDQLQKPSSQLNLGKNVYINKTTEERIFYPRIGSFQIYIYNILISSKLSSNSWPNHYKVLQTLNQIVAAKRQNLPLDQFSIYNSDQPMQKYKQETSQKRQKSPRNDSKARIIMESRQKAVQKKKKSLNPANEHTSINRFRVYKSKQTNQSKAAQKQQKAQKSVNKSTVLDPLTLERKQKLYSTLVPASEQKNKPTSQRYLQSKQQVRTKLPSLKNSMNLVNERNPKKKSLIDELSFFENKKSKPAFNSIDETLFDKEMSIIEKDNETIRLLDSSQNGFLLNNNDGLGQNRLDSLQLYNNEDSIIGLQSIINKQSPTQSPRDKSHRKGKLGSNYSLYNDEFADMRVLENKSVQYSERQVKDLMNRSIQYEANEEGLNDFGVQIDQAKQPKEITYQFVQTERVEIVDQKEEQERKKKGLKPYMLDEAIQVQIVIKKKQITQQIQTPIPQLQSTQTNTDPKSYVNRAQQFPLEQQMQQGKLPKIQVDLSFTHLYQKRRNLPIDQGQQLYSVDKFEEKSTKYKWIGKGRQGLKFHEIKEKLLIESMVFAVYNFFGIKTPEKRLAFVQCANVMDKISSLSSGMYHVMVQQNPQIQYLGQFEQFNLREKRFPLSEEITYKSSKQNIKFNNWGKFLALMHFLDDRGVFDHSAVKRGSFNENAKKIEKDLEEEPEEQPKQREEKGDDGRNRWGSTGIGFVITNEEVRQIYRMEVQNYQLYQTNSSSHQNSMNKKQTFQAMNDKKAVNDQTVIHFSSLPQQQCFIDPSRLSKSTELEFISMLSRLTQDKTFGDLENYLKDLFINVTKVYDEKVAKLLGSIEKYAKGEKNNANGGHTTEEKGQQLSQQVTQLLNEFIQKLKNRRDTIAETFKGKIYVYRKYNQLSARINYSIPSTSILQRHYSLNFTKSSMKANQSRIQLTQIIKMLRNSAQMLFMTGQQASGKSWTLKQVQKQLQQGEKFNVLYLQDIGRIDSFTAFVDDKFYEKKKNILLIDNISSATQSKHLVRFVKSIYEPKQDKYDTTFLCVIDAELFQSLSIKLNGIFHKNIPRQQKFINLKLLPLNEEQIKLFISKSVDFKNVTQKHELSQKITTDIAELQVLRNPFYLGLYCQIIEPSRLDQFIRNFDARKVSKWSIMKATWNKCRQRHITETRQMGMTFSDNDNEQQNVISDLKQLVMKMLIIDYQPQKYILSRRTENDPYISKHQIASRAQQVKLSLLQEFVDKFEAEEESALIKNHLDFYPLDLKYLVKVKTEKAFVSSDDNDQNEKKSVIKDKASNVANIQQPQTASINIKKFFLNSQFYTFLLAESFSYYLSQGYKNLSISTLTRNPNLLQLIKEKSQHQPSFCQSLLQLVYSTVQFSNLSPQASTAMTLLCLIRYPFSNMIFDHCQLNEADLSLTTFYNCSFRDTGLKNSVMYKTSMLNCSIDQTVMDNVNLLVRKYEIEFTPLCCALSPDGKLLALGCGNYLIVVAAQTGKQLKKIEAHLDIIRSVKFSKDGNNLVTLADDKTLRSWDTHTFKSVVFKLPQKGGSVYFSNESQTIATIVNKTDLKVWNLKSMANEALFQGHTDAITTVSFSVNGQYILTGSKDTTLRLWNLKGKQLHTYKSHQKQIITAKMSPTNGTIASSSKDNNKLTLHQTISEEIIIEKEFDREIIEICLELKEEFVCVVFAGSDKVTVLSFGGLELVHQFQGHTQKVVSMGFDFGYERLLSLSKDRTVRLWDFGQIIKKELAESEVSKTQQTSAGPILSIAYSKQLKSYATGHQSGQINIWHQHTNRILHKLQDHSGYVSKLQFDSSGKLYSGGKDGTLRIWNVQKLQLSKKNSPYKKIELFSVEMVEMKINQKNRLMVMTSSNSELVVYDFTGIKLILSTRDEGRVNAVAFDQKDRFMAVGGNEKFVVTYKIENGGNSLKRSEQLGEHPQIITSLAYQGDSLLISVLKNGHIYIWNHMRATLMKKIQNLSPITCLDIYSKKYACMSSEDGKIRIINLDEGKQVKVFKYKQACVQFVTKTVSLSEISCDNMPVMFAGCRDGNLMKWNLFGLSKGGDKRGILPAIEQRKTNRFGRRAIDEEGGFMVEVEGEKSIRLKNLNEHTEQVIRVEKCPGIIEGVEFIDGDQQKSKEKFLNPLNRVILLLKSGQFWSIASQSMFEPSFSNPSHFSLLIQAGNMEGDLIYVKNKEQLFFKSGVKKVSKQIKKPSQLIVDEVTIGG